MLRKDTIINGIVWEKGLERSSFYKKKRASYNPDQERVAVFAFDNVLWDHE